MIKSCGKKPLENAIFEYLLFLQLQQQKYLVLKLSHFPTLVNFLLLQNEIVPSGAAVCRNFSIFRQKIFPCEF